MGQAHKLNGGEKKMAGFKKARMRGKSLRKKVTKPKLTGKVPKNMRLVKGKI
jgi:hypothetical protein